MICHLATYLSPKTQSCLKEKTTGIIVNKTCHRFCFRGGAGHNSLLDDFLITWSPGLVYAYPLIPLVPRVFRKISRYNNSLNMAQIVLVLGPCEPVRTTHDSAHNTPRCDHAIKGTCPASLNLIACWLVDIY